MPHDYDNEGYRQVTRNKGKGPQRQSALQQSTLPFTAADNPQPGPSRPRQNLNKSLDAQLDLLHTATPDDYDLLLLQEPYLDHLNLTHANHH
ncbi:hypothetical protein A0H81_14888 [Grifola frondosa]|uniref:Endonuclease/exonuclease/phosphatase domain-containing protein n=1 Tax=Grifola frondosa TaxID=5627 RepID=A0A1C7LK27_GRIFR|nr:hypothetical protein A0H81_14888 [Grifola frondosa]